MKLLWQPKAIADLDDIWTYSVATWGAARAERYLRTLYSEADASGQGLISGVEANDVRPGLRRHVLGSHVLWFRINDETLRVIRVLHQSRDARRWME